MNDQQELLATSYGSAAVAAPGSAATITLWSSVTAGLSATTGARFKRIIVSVIASSASAASGLQFDISVDGSNWDNLVSYSISANTMTVNYVSIPGSPFIRVRYVNSANVLTTWRMWVAGDQTERASQ
jgi:hypothetical protein